MKFKYFSRKLSDFQVCFKTKFIFKDFSRHPFIFKYFSSMCKPWIVLKEVVVYFYFQITPKVLSDFNGWENLNYTMMKCGEMFYAIVKSYQHFYLQNTDRKRQYCKLPTSYWLRLVANCTKRCASSYLPQRYKILARFTSGTSAYLSGAV